MDPELLDHFAGHAIAGLLANNQVFNPSPYQVESDKWITAFRALSTVAYSVAEAMVIERNTRRNKEYVDRLLASGIDEDLTGACHKH